MFTMLLKYDILSQNAYDLHEYLESIVLSILITKTL